MSEFPNKATQFSSTNQPKNNGRPKGSKSLATLIRQLENEDFDWDKVPIKSKDTVKEMGSPFQAIVYVALGQALSGDRHAREWLRKAGYGDKLDITSKDEKIQPVQVVDLGALHANQSETESDSTDDQEQE